jgi:hypothetical protein
MPRMVLLKPSHDPANRFDSEAIAAAQGTALLLPTLDFVLWSRTPFDWCLPGRPQTRALRGHPVNFPALSSSTLGPARSDIARSATPPTMTRRVGDELGRAACLRHPTASSHRATTLRYAAGKQREIKCRVGIVRRAIRRPVCTENLIRIDYVSESPNVCGTMIALLCFLLTVLVSATDIASSSSSCIDGFPRFSMPSRSSDRRPCALA